MYEKITSFSSAYFLRMRERNADYDQDDSLTQTVETMKKKLIYLQLLLLLTLIGSTVVSQAQSDSLNSMRRYKNVVRYNLTGALLFGFDKYVVFGYERVIKPNQSISINFGGASLPKLVSISTDSFSVSKDKKSNGFNISVDYRFYLGKENKYPAPRGVYIGPYYSYNKFTRDNQWLYKKSGSNSYVTTTSTFNINTIGFEFGYQFILWKRFSLDLVLVGPGYGIYNYKVKFDTNLSPQNKEQLLEGLKQLLTQKFPGMNYVFADKEIDANGTLKANTLGYRYIIHIGFAF